MSAFTSPHNDNVRSEQCYFCPRRDSLESHHIVPQRFNGSDSAENLVVVCERCHRKLERLYDARFYEGFGVEDHGKQRLSHIACRRRDCSNTATHKYRVTGEVGGTAMVYVCAECLAESDHAANATAIVDNVVGRDDA